MPLGFRVPTVPYSQGYGVSGDGHLAVGQSLLTGGIGGQSGAFLWTRDFGITSAFDITGASSTAAAANADGSVIVGWADFGAFSPLGAQAYLTGPSGGAQLLGDFPTNPNGVPRSFARGVSADGSVIVGYGLSSHGTEAFVYSPALQTFTGLGALASGASFSSWAYGVSANGQVVVGSSYSAANQLQAFRWSAGSGMVAIPYLDTPAGVQRYSQAEAVSADGSVIVGECRSTASGNGLEAFRWTAASGSVGLGDLAGGAFQSWAYALTPDGATVVGRATIDGPSGPFGGGSAPRAFIWDAAHGLRDLQQVLVDAGASLAGWSLQEARGISSDGLTIVGTGTDPQNNTQAWIATLPPPPACYANCDGSTSTPVLNVNDFVCFLNRFAAGDPYANCDHSTTAPTLNVLDFQCFLNAFAAGC
jgi:probable HAF family extracellular repeat protein